MRIASIQLAYGDDESVADRRSRVLDLVRQEQAADLVVLPELWGPSGFDHRLWQERAEPVDGPTMESLGAVAKEIGAVVHAGSIIESTAEGMFNTSVVFGRDGQRVSTYRKMHRFGFGVGEPRLLELGQEVTTFTQTFDGRDTTVGLATCYDLRFPELFRALQAQGAELVIIPAAWPRARVEAWRVLSRARAMENQCVVVTCNTAGTHAGQEMGGHSAIIGPDGMVLAEAGSAAQTLVMEVDLRIVGQARDSFPVLQDRRPLADFEQVSA